MRLVKPVIATACVSTAWLAAMVLARPAPSTSAATSVPATISVAADHLTTSVTPNPSAPGTRTTFDVDCGPGAFSATLFGVTLGTASLILMHSAPGGMSGEFTVTVTLPTSIRPGSYHPSVDCSNGAAGGFAFAVNPVPLQAPETGDGATSTQTDTPLVPVGYGLAGLGALALAAVLALRRRSTARH
jgi:MYXO-CTERM domain-containing protein